MRKLIIPILFLLFLARDSHSQSDTFGNEVDEYTDTSKSKSESYFSAGAGVLTKFQLKQLRFDLDDGVGIFLTFNVNSSISKLVKFSLGLDLLSDPDSRGGVGGIANISFWLSPLTSKKVTWLLGGGIGGGFASNGREGGVIIDLLMGTRIMYKISQNNALGLETKYNFAGKFLSYNVFITF